MMAPPRRRRRKPKIMGFARAVRALRLSAGAVALTASFVACAGRPPVLVPPSSGVEAVEGFASASIAGADAAIKGKFAFLFRRPGFGRVEAVDPIGRTAFLVFFREGRAWFVLPSKKIYAEDEAAVMMGRFLGVALSPDEAIALVSGIWPEDPAAQEWGLGRDEQGRVARGARGDHAFTVREFFRGGAAPREIALNGSSTSGRLKILKLAFNPTARDEAFDVSFLNRYAAKTWEEILELLDR
jgi:hypothetical protein